MADWQAKKWNSTLATLDGLVQLGLSCKNDTGWWPKTDILVNVDRFSTIDVATHAFIATGAVGYEDVTISNEKKLSCTDGGHASGAKMTNLFQDNVRPQLIIDLMRTGFPTVEMGFGKFIMQQYASLVRRGQDEAAEFLTRALLSEIPRQ